MSKAVSPQLPQSTTWSVDAVHVPLLPAACEPPAGAADPTGDADPRFLHDRFAQRLLVAAGEAESAEWMLDHVLGDAAETVAELGVGLDVEPLDSVLESALWALDQATGLLHAELRSAVRHGVPLEAAARAAALDVEEVRAVLASPEDGDLAASARSCPEAGRHELAPAV